MGASDNYLNPNPAPGPAPNPAPGPAPGPAPANPGPAPGQPPAGNPPPGPPAGDPPANNNPPADPPASNNPPADWREALPEDIRTAPALKQFQNIQDLASNFIEQSRHLGTMIKMPTENSLETEIEAFIEKAVEKSGGKLQRVHDISSPDYEQKVLRDLGMPDAPDKYSTPEEAASLDKEWLDGTRKVFHEAGLTDKQQQVLLKAKAQQEGQTVSMLQEARKAEVAKLQNEWGIDTPRRIDMAAAYAKASGAPAELVAHVEAGNANAELLQWLYNQAQNIGESSQFNSQGFGDPADTPGQKREEIAKLEETMAKLDEDPSHSNKQKQIAIQKKIISLREEIDQQVSKHN